MKKALAATVMSVVLVLGGAAIADDIEKLDPSIQKLDPSIEKIEQTKKEGATTVVTLSSDILFDFGSSTVSAAAVAKIGQLVAKVPKGATIAVDGHTDNVPYKRGNDVLSRERAQAVAAAITKARPDVKPKVTGHGESKPVASNDTPENRAKNRRVEIRYQG